MDYKKVSAIITTHNREPDIVLRAVKSVIKQSYSNIEIIVVDDSSYNFSQRDKVEQEVKNLSDKIIYIRHKGTQGACVARNTGLLHSNGYYIAFLDDDDEWLPNKIEVQIRGFKNDSIAMVYCGTQIIDQIRNEKYVRKTEYRRGKVFEWLLLYNYIGNTSNPLIRKDCLDKVGRFDINMQSAQDYDLWLRIAMHYLIDFEEEPLINYYIHENEHISANIDKKTSGHERINSKYKKYLERNKLTWYMRHRILIPMYVKKKWRKKALDLWIKCVIKEPYYVIYNTKLLLTIVFGYDSVFYQIYRCIVQVCNQAQKKLSWFCL